MARVAAVAGLLLLALFAGQAQAQTNIAELLSRPELKPFIQGEAASERARA